MPASPSLRRDRALVHHARAHERVVLGVHGHEAVGHLGVLQRAPQELGAWRTGTAVVAEADGAGLGELVHLGELLAGAGPCSSAAKKPVGTVASTRACRARPSSTGAESTTGSVLAMPKTAT